MSTNGENGDGLNKPLRGMSRVNMLIAVCGLVFVVALYAWMRWGNDTDQKTDSIDQGQLQVSTRGEAVLRQQTQQEIKENYETELNTTLAGYDFDDVATARTLQTRVEKMTVSVEFKALHIQVVAALEDVQTEQYDSAKKRIASLREQYTWLLPE